MSRSIANIGAGEDPMADQGRSGTRFPVRVRSSFSLGLRVVVGTSSFALLCSADASLMAAVDRSKLTSTPSLSSFLPGWPVFRTSLECQRCLAAITNAAFIYMMCDFALPKLNTTNAHELAHINLGTGRNGPIN